MSEPVVFQRRDFLKLVGVGVAGAAAGCAQPPAEKLIPYLVAPNDILPGVPYWYASTCGECPAGCGVLVKAREGRAIKIEGNPAHPVNRGGLCARGQAGLQGLYNPDRVTSPMVRQDGQWKPIAWDAALQLAGQKLADARARGAVAIMTDHRTGSLHRLAAEWAAAVSGSHLVYEPFAHESLREANRRSFGQAEIPNYDFAAAKMIVSFGADFLETWLSPTGHARGFAAARAASPMAHFVAIEPRLSLTGANADEWVAVRPGGEMALALGLAHVIVRDSLARNRSDAIREALSAWTPEAVSKQTDVPAEEIEHMAHHFVKASPSLAVAGGIAAQSEQSVALMTAVNLLNWVAGNVGQTVRFDRTLAWSEVGSFSDMQKLIADMNAGKVDVLIVHGANPLYSVPAWAGFGAALGKVPYKISLTGVFDETAESCDMLLPSQHTLESWGDSERARGVWSLAQPAMQPLPMFDSKPAGETLIALGKAAGVGAAWPDLWLDYLKAQWKGPHQRFGAGRDFDGFWADCVQKGGVWSDVPATTVGWTGGAPAFVAPELKGAGEFALVLYSSPNLYDGRGADKAWLQELPDPTTKAVWGSWVEIHPDTAGKLGIGFGDPVRIETEAGSVELPAYPYAGIRPDAVAVPLGQGHTALGRYAKNLGVNALALLSPAQDPASGAVAYLSAKAKVSKGSKAATLVVSQREKNQHDRGIAQIIPMAALVADSTGATHQPSVTEHHGIYPNATAKGKNTEPLDRPADFKMPAHAVSAFEPLEKSRRPRQNPADVGMYKNAQHRWAMAIDLQSCTGCSACVVACSAENNIPTVGPELVKRGREMMWIRIERWEEKVGAGRTDVRHVPMMCQHCGDAPCEMVCPVYATYHNPEGLNAQVYNRCVGTRYCSNNCPYKVRTFNFFDYSAPEKATFAFPAPLNWQLNPDVTVRSKGIMEKCTMCVQRILEGKGVAKDENRAVRDGDIVTACAQSCPTQAIVFGDLVDPESRVSKMSFENERHYWVLNELNTKPGVTYLKKITWHNDEEPKS